MTIKEKSQRDNGRPPTILDDAINKARDKSTGDFPTLRAQDAIFIAHSTDFVIKRGFRRGTTRVFLMDEIRGSVVRGVNRRGRKVVWDWERTPDGRGIFRRGLDVVKARIHDAPR